jgi:hypothetical protein
MKRPVVDGVYVDVGNGDLPLAVVQKKRLQGLESGRKERRRRLDYAGFNQG